MILIIIVFLSIVLTNLLTNISSIKEKIEKFEFSDNKENQKFFNELEDDLKRNENFSDKDKFEDIAALLDFFIRSDEIKRAEKCFSKLKALTRSYEDNFWDCKTIL